MIDIVIYKCSADNRVVDKTPYLDQVKRFENCIIKEDNSIMDISLTFMTPNMDILSDVNYVYIPSLETYYYINDIVFLSGNRVKILCHEDVLTTYKDEIKNLSCVVSRQEYKFNQYLDDDKFKVYNYRRIQTLAFPNGFNKNNCQYILAVMGGV